jgi:hypothetical protein
VHYSEERTVTAPLAFIDCETTGLHPADHEIWEVAVVLRGGPEGRDLRVWQLPVDAGRADPMSLDIGGWYERRWPISDISSPHEQQAAVTGYDLRSSDHDGDPRRALLAVNEIHMHTWAVGMAYLLHGRHLVGACVSFDAERLARLLRRHGACPSWHYHLVDCEAFAAGSLASRSSSPSLFLPPWRSEDLSRAVGVEPDKFDRHTALGDALWAEAMYDAAIGTGQ